MTTTRTEREAAGLLGRFAGALFIAAAACASLEPAAPPVTPGDAVFAFRVDHFGEGYSLEVRASGEARYRATRRRADARGVNTDKRARLSAAEVDSLRARFAEHAMCDLKVPKRMRVAEEATVTYALGFPGLTCSIDVMENDWGRLRGTRECNAMVESVIERIKRAP